nr:DUF3418 domain-containing protein [Actinomycetes bacterium]
PERALAVVRAVERVLRAAQAVDAGLEQLRSPSVRAAHDDVRAQVDALVRPGFVAAVGAGRLDDVARYLRAAARRVDRLPHRPGRDADLMAEQHAVEDAYRAAVAALPPARRADPDVRAVRWLLEELRVGLFAQEVGTAVPVSATRVLRAVDALGTG